MDRVLFAIKRDRVLETAQRSVQLHFRNRRLVRNRRIDQARRNSMALHCGLRRCFSDWMANEPDSARRNVLWRDNADWTLLENSWT